MKVIKRIGKQSGWSKLAICTGKGNGWGGCWSILRISRIDLYKTCYMFWGEVDKICTTFCCPNCETETNVWVPDRINFGLPSRKDWFAAKKKEDKMRQEFITVDGAVTIASAGIVLIERTKPPFEGKLVLPGGHVEVGESLVDACVRELAEEICLRVSPENLKLLTILDSTGRDPRPGHGFSVVYTIDLPRVEALTYCKAGSDAKAMYVRDIASIRPEELGFDHAKAIDLLRE